MPVCRRHIEILASAIDRPSSIARSGSQLQLTSGNQKNGKFTKKKLTELVYTGFWSSALRLHRTVFGQKRKTSKDRNWLN